jgi:DNA-directed RNA polymerase I subunit RPA2
MNLIHTYVLDGAPCGLLNHVTASCNIVTHAIDNKPLINLLRKLDVINHQEMNMIMQSSTPGANKSATHYPVIVDGIFLGYIARDKAPLLERRLRALKVDSQNNDVPYTTEITLIRYSTDVKQIITQFPGLYIYTCIGRMIRPVTNLAAKKTEYIGKFSLKHSIPTNFRDL